MAKLSLQSISLSLLIFIVQAAGLMPSALAQQSAEACDTAIDRDFGSFEFQSNSEDRLKLVLEPILDELVDRLLKTVSADIRDKLLQDTLIEHTRDMDDGKLIVSLRGRSATSDNMKEAEQRIKEAIPSSRTLLLRRHMLSLEQTSEYTFELRVKEHARKSILKNALSRSIKIVQRRLDPDGVNNVSISAEGGHHFKVISYPVDNVEGLKDTITRRGDFYFAMAKPWQEGPPSSTWRSLKFSDEGLGCLWVNVSSPVITGEEIRSASHGFDELNRPQINFNLNTEGVAQFSRFTVNNPNALSAIVLDGEIMSAPRINDPIFGAGVRITGDFTIEQAEKLASIIEGGELPASLTIVEERMLSQEELDQLTPSED